MNVSGRIVPLLRQLLYGALPFAAALTVGAFAGAAFYTFAYAEGFSYVRNDPEVCTNCHVMQDYYDSWIKSGHRHVAVCNDCHLPHHPVGKYVVKADNGFFHSWAFTFDTFGTQIRIKPRNRRVTQQACIHCHQDIVEQMLPESPQGEMMLCIHCHADAGHGPR